MTPAGERQDLGICLRPSLCGCEAWWAGSDSLCVCLFFFLTERWQRSLFPLVLTRLFASLPPPVEC